MWARRRIQIGRLSRSSSWFWRDRPWLFLVPLYLWQRSRRVGQGQSLLAAWIAVFVISIAGSAALTAKYVTLDMATVEATITSGVHAQANTSSTVHCPAAVVHGVGSTFICDVTDASGSAHVQVKVEKTSGDFTWNLTG